VVSGNPHPVQPAGKIGQKISRHRIEPGGPLRIVEIVAQTQHARGLGGAGEGVDPPERFAAVVRGSICPVRANQLAFSR
jgi:hypothetical protein